MILLTKLTDLIERITNRQVIIFILKALVVFVIFFLGNWFYRNYSVSATFLFGDSTKSNGELAKFVITIVGGLLVFYGLLLNARRTKAMEIQNEISMSGQVGERFKNAIEHLGSENSAIILGGIHALHRIAKDNDSYRPVVFEILCSYIREKTHLINIEDIDPDDLKQKKPTIVIQTIVDVLFKSHRSNEYIYSDLVADLRGVNCINVDFTYARLDDVVFLKAQLHYANFSESTLQYVSFNGSNLYNANFSNCYLKEVDFENCRMVHVNMIKSICFEVDFGNCMLVNALFIESELVNAKFNSSVLRNAHFEVSNLTDADLSDTNLQQAHFEASILIRTNFHEANVKEAYFEGASPFEYRNGDIEEDLDIRLGKEADLCRVKNIESEVITNSGILNEAIKNRITRLYKQSLKFE